MPPLLLVVNFSSEEKSVLRMLPAFNMVFRRLLFFSKISLFFAPLLLSAQSVKENTQFRLNAYFTKDHLVKNFVALTKDSLYLYSDPKAKAQHIKPEVALSWKQVSKLSTFINKLHVKELANLFDKGKDSLNFYLDKYTSTYSEYSIPTSLKGMKIAIDPGHIGGTYDMGFAESRCMTLQIDSLGHADSIRLVEGNLTFYTAQILKKKLESQGAQVMFTRKDTGLTAFDITYYEWKKRARNPKYLDSLVDEGLMTSKDRILLGRRMSDKAYIKAAFGSIDMAERAKKINAFNPDLTVIIHYNVNETNAPWVQPTTRDFTMTFVGGCVITKDLETYSGRLNFLRLLISPDIDNSIQFSSKVVKRLSDNLNIPIATKEDATYLSKNSIATSAKGVYSRDLALTRIIRGPLVYGEGLYQDNCTECLLLSGKGDGFKGCDPMQRLQKVADAYYQGILDYLASLRK